MKEQQPRSTHIGSRLNEFLHNLQERHLDSEQETPSSSEEPGDWEQIDWLVDPKIAVGIQIATFAVGLRLIEFTDEKLPSGAAPLLTRLGVACVVSSVHALNGIRSILTDRNKPRNLAGGP